MNETAPEADAEKSLLPSAESMTSSLPQKSTAELPWIPNLGSMSLVVRSERHKAGQALCYLYFPSSTSHHIAINYHHIN
jgi:hypothetical protein